MTNSIDAHTGLTTTSTGEELQIQTTGVVNGGHTAADGDGGSHTAALATGGIILALVVILAFIIYKITRKKPEITDLPTPDQGESAPALDGAAPQAPVQTPITTPDAPAEPPVQAEPREEPVTTLSQGLAKTRAEGFVGILGRLFSKSTQVDTDIMDQIEEVLFKADIGVQTTGTLVEEMRKQLRGAELTNPDKIWQFLEKRSREILDLPAPDIKPANHTDPKVIMVVGVNGVGKTTTIGKLANIYSKQDRRVLLAAGDTFRAAAVQQLEVWGERTGSPVVKGHEGADPSSVIFEAIRRAKEEGYHMVIADTAGRLHTKAPLMDELKKIHRVMGRAQEGAPHEVLLVLDSNTGQNAIHQARQFSEILDLTGIVLTKLDGTARGGIILGICDELKIPVRYIGIGEQAEDLRPFDPEAFVDALYGKS